MRKRHLCILICLFANALFFANAANRTITGVVISGEDNEPLIGASVYVSADELKKAGKSKEEISFLKKFKSFPGNRPSNLILLKKVDPYSLGALIAMYEHKVFVQGMVWNIDSYDQMGVELGKQMALNILPELQNNVYELKHDSSTNALIKTIRAMRK